MRISSIEERIAARRDRALLRSVLGRTGHRAFPPPARPERKTSAPVRLPLIILALLVILWAIA